MSEKPLRNTSASVEPGTDWVRFDAQTDEEIEAAVARDPDVAPILAGDWFERAELVTPGRKRAISIRLDPEVLDFFQARGAGYQSRINAVLRAYVTTQRERKLVRALLGPAKTGIPKERSRTKPAVKESTRTAGIGRKPDRVKKAGPSTKRRKGR